MDFTELLPLLSQGGVPGMLVAFIFALYRGWIVLGPTHVAMLEACHKERRWWRDFGTSQLGDTGRAIGLAERISS